MRRNKVRDFLEFCLFYLFYIIVCLLPKWIVFKFGEVIAEVVFRRRKNVLVSNIKLAFNEKLDPEVIYKEVKSNISRSIIEVMRLVWGKDKEILSNININGKEYIDEVLKKEKGAILMGAHFGNFLLLNIFLRAVLNYPIAVVVRDFENPYLAKFSDWAREKVYKIETIKDKPKRECAIKCINALRENKLVVILIDQNASRRDIYVPFFGREVPTYRGIITISKRTKAPIIPIFIKREEDSKFTVFVEKPIYFEDNDFSLDVLKSQLTYLTKICEDYIRKYPNQWWWFHRRWRKAK